MKNTKDIIEDILRERDADYDLTDSSHTGYSPKPRDSVQIENGANVLVSDDARECADLNDLENYRPCQEIDFEVTEVKEIFEKKKKKRNYIEFREEHVKVR
jgi:hypothetical protein